MTSILYRTLTFFIFVGIFASVFFIGTISEPTQEEAQMLADEFEKIVLEISAIDIFLHNLGIALLMFIPAAGIVAGMISAWSTGFAFASLGLINPEIGMIPPLSIFLTPFGLLEISAYAIATSSSFHSIHKIIKRQPIISYVKPFAIEISLVVALLLIGGYVEDFLIQELQNGNLNPSDII